MKTETYYEGYFIYKGVAYGVGTKVVFYDDVYNHISNSKAKNQPHTFVTGSSSGWKGFYWEENTIPRPKMYYNNISIYNPDKEIKEIIEPVYVELVPWQKQSLNNMVNGTVHPDVFGGVLLYVLVMAVGSIFFARFTIWVFATVVFVIWLLNEYRA
jgi:hypothetical protein